MELAPAEVQALLTNAKEAIFGAEQIYELPINVDEKTFIRQTVEHFAKGEKGGFLLDKAKNLFVAPPPADFLKEMQFGAIEKTYVPVHVYDVSYDYNWQGEIGYDRQETYLGTETSYEKTLEPVAGSHFGKTLNQIPMQEGKREVSQVVEKTRTVTDWQTSSGRVSGRFSVVLDAGVPAELKAYISNLTMNYGVIREHSSPASSYTVLPFVIDKESNISKNKDEFNSRILKGAEQQLPGDHNRGISWTANSITLNSSSSVLIPVYSLKSNYKEYPFLSMLCSCSDVTCGGGFREVFNIEGKFPKVEKKEPSKLDKFKESFKAKSAVQKTVLIILGIVLLPILAPIALVVGPIYGLYHVIQNREKWDKHKECVQEDVERIINNWQY